MFDAWRDEQHVHFADITNRLSSDNGAKIVFGQSVFQNADLTPYNLSSSVAQIADLKNLEPGTILVLNNNDIYKIGIDAYLRLYLGSPQSIFVI